MQAEIEESRKKTAAVIERLRVRSREMREGIFGSENAGRIVEEIAALSEDETAMLLFGMIEDDRSYDNVTAICKLTQTYALHAKA